MRVPLLDLRAQLATIRNEVKIAVNDVIESTQYIMGPKVFEFEKKVAEYSKTLYGIGVSSGTDALLVSLMALDIEPGDLVITTPYTFFATVGVIARMKATPVFVDINPDSYNMDPEKLQEWFNVNKDKINKVKAIIPVHLFGQCADMKPILDIANGYNIPVVEDAAQAIGAKYPFQESVKKAGSMGTMGCFSFFPSKNLGGIGDGGMVITNSRELEQKLIKLRNHGSSPKYYQSIIGGNFRLDTIQAAVLLVKIKYLENWHKDRQYNAEYYDENLKTPEVKKPKIMYKRDYHIYNQYVISVSDKRDDLRRHFIENNIGHEVYYPLPIHSQECFRYLGYKKGDFPNAEYASEHTIALPIYPELTTEMQDYVIEKIEEFYK
jgi:dTDP-4-amino-4,6-dideoxygalactose transaminase